MTNRILAACVLLVLGLPFASAQLGASGGKPQPKANGAIAASQPDDAAIVRRDKPSYPLKACAVSGEKLTDSAVDTVAGGRLVRVCCAKCVKAVQESPAKFADLVRDAVIAAQKPAYPLAHCPVTGERLGADAIDHVHGTRLVRLANAKIVAEFERDPARFLGKVDQGWIDAQKPAYKATTCPVSGHELDAHAVDHLYGTRLVRLCCTECVAKFDATPAKFLAVLDGPAPAPK